MVERALERGHLNAGWVAADHAFGISPSFREYLASLGMRYVLDVPAGFTVWPVEPELFNVNYFCRLASIILAGSPPYADPAAGPLRSGSWGHRIPG